MVLTLNFSENLFTSVSFCLLHHEELGIDDSDVPLKVLVQELAGKPKKTGSYIVSEEGGFVLSTLAEQFEEMVESEVEMEVIDTKLGHGKRCKQANRLYSVKTFQMHGDESSDEDIQV